MRVRFVILFCSHWAYLECLGCNYAMVLMRRNGPDYLFTHFLGDLEIQKNELLMVQFQGQAGLFLSAKDGVCYS